MNASESNSAPAAIVFDSTYGLDVTPNETHLNRGPGKPWWHTPAVAGSVALAIGVLIFIISISAFGDDVSLMLRKLI